MSSGRSSETAYNDSSLSLDPYGLPCYFTPHGQLPSYPFSSQSATSSFDFSNNSLPSGAAQLPSPAALCSSPLRSAVWDHFQKDSDELLGDFSTCTVVLHNGEICGARKSRHIQVLKNHLKEEHSNIFDQMIAENALWAASESAVTRQELLNEAVAIFIGATNTPYSIVDNEHFRIMLGSFDPTYRIPGHDRLASVINNVITKMKLKIQRAMSTARKIHLCANIWSEKKLTSSYLVLTAHFFSFTDQKLHHPALAVRWLDHPHTGEAISALAYAIIEEWGIPLSKLQFIITDDGSSMLKAFKSLNHDEDILDELAFEDGEGSDDEISEFALEQHEINSSEAFKKHAGLQRLDCFSCTLQLVVAKFTQDANCKEILRKVDEIVKSVNQLGKAVEALIREGGRKLVSSCMTRWYTAYLVIHRLLQVKEPLKKILHEFKLTVFQPEEWEALEAIDNLLSKFAMYIDIGRDENYALLSMVIPSFLELEAHLKGLLELPVVGNTSNVLLQELYRRFSRLLDFQDNDHNPVYVIATLLDPRYKMILDDNHINYAKKELLKMVNSEVESLSDDNFEAALGDPEGEPELKKPRLFPFVYELMSKKAQDRKDSRKSVFEIQLENYVRSTDGHMSGEFSDPLLYWAKSTPGYSQLAPVAIGILSAPSASTAIEGTFDSTTEEATFGKQKRLMEADLEKEVLLRKNKIYYSSTV